MAARYLPISLDVHGRRCLIIGGGHEALKKAVSLVEAGAAVHLISPDVLPGLAELIGIGCVTWEQRPYRPGDLQGYFLAFACTDAEQVNAAVTAEAGAAGVLLNVVDQPARCHFIMPAVARQGSLTFAITTDGKSPALAKRFREELEATYGPAHAEFLEVLGALRPLVRAAGLPLAARMELFSRLVQSDALAALLAGDRAAMRDQIANLVKEYDVPCPEEWSTLLALDPATRI